jgi:hypothetical protein
MRIRPLIVISFLLAAVFFGLSLPAQAAPPAQGIQFATNTPLPNGNIYYIIQQNDTCTKIEYLYGITDAQLRQLNETINTDCSNLQIGQKVLVGTGGPIVPSATPGPSPTPLPPTITPTPPPGTTQICVLLFDDINGNALHDTNEPVISGGAISVTETSGKYSKTLQTAVNADPNAYPGVCFNNLPEGHYNIAAAIPDGYNPTTSLTSSLDLKAGDSDYVDFGAQSRDATVSNPQPSGDSSGPSPALGIFGGLLLLGGLGLGWYALRLRRPQSKLKQSGLLKR